MTPGAGVERRDSGSRGHRRRRRCRGGLLKKGAVPAAGTNGPRLALLLVLLAGTSPAASAQDVEELRILAPLYARPDGETRFAAVFLVAGVCVFLSCVSQHTWFSLAFELDSRRLCQIVALVQSPDIQRTSSIFFLMHHETDAWWCGLVRMVASLHTTPFCVAF